MSVARSIRERAVGVVQGVNVSAPERSDLDAVATVVRALADPR